MLAESVQALDQSLENDDWQKIIRRTVSTNQISESRQVGRKKMSSNLMPKRFITLQKILSKDLDRDDLNFLGQRMHIVHREMVKRPRSFSGGLLVLDRE